MNDQDLALELRPQRFEDVRGQEHPVRFLSGLIKRGQIGRNLLLHGAFGSGKTSLAYIYVRALNCESPTSAGSPCGTCRWCKEPDDREAGLYEYDVGGTGGDRDKIRSFLELYNHTPPSSAPKYRVLFFDEAHRLEPAAAESLLKNVEQPKQGVRYIFATTEYRRLLPTLRSRLNPLEIRALSPVQAIRFLQDVARRKGYEYDDAALRLLAGVKNGHPRDLVIGLEQVAAIGPVTTANVREMFDIDHTEVLVDYFRALADADKARQTEIMAQWNEPGVEKIKFVSAFLLAIYYNEILGEQIVVEPLTDSIRSERAEILTRFMNRLAVPRASELEPYWREMIEFWAQPNAAEDEVAVLLRFSLFHALVNSNVVGHSRPLRRVVRRKATTAAPSTAALPPDPGCWESTTPFLEADDVRSIVNRASFLIKEYGVLFNAAFRFRTALFGINAEEDARRLVEEFVFDLQKLAGTYSDEDAKTFAHLSTLERDDHGNLRARIVAHLPDAPANGPERSDWNDRIFTWASQWRDDQKVYVGVVEVAVGEPGQSGLNFHWKQALDLCAGLDENVEDIDPSRTEPQPLLPLLKVPRREWRPAGRLDGGRLLASPLLSAATIAPAGQHGTPPPSAIEDRAWEWIRKGWEFREYQKRQRRRQKYDKQRAEILQTYGRDTPEANAELQRLELSLRMAAQRAPWRKSYAGAALIP
jgi:DNA polymerase III subunit gamma/tau